VTVGIFALIIRQHECSHVHFLMTRRSSPSIPKGATGIYRLDCPSSPPRFEDGEQLTVVKKGPVGHCTVCGSAGTEAIIRNTEILLDEKWSMHQAPLPCESGVDWAEMQNDVNARGHMAD
jgi:hypothetical protein